MARGEITAAFLGSYQQGVGIGADAWRQKQAQRAREIENAARAAERREDLARADQYRMEDRTLRSNERAQDAVYRYDRDAVEDERWNKGYQLQRDAAVDRDLQNAIGNSARTGDRIAADSDARLKRMAALEQKLAADTVSGDLRVGRSPNPADVFDAGLPQYALGGKGGEDISKRADVQALTVEMQGTKVRYDELQARIAEARRAATDVPFNDRASADQLAKTIRDLEAQRDREGIQYQALQKRMQQVYDAAAARGVSQGGGYMRQPPAGAAGSGGSNLPVIPHRGPVDPNLIGRPVRSQDGRRGVYTERGIEIVN